MKSQNWFELVLFASLVVGCADSSPNRDSNDSSLESNHASTTPPEVVFDDQIGETPSPQVSIVDWRHVQQWVANQSGKVVVMDVWSTYCLPCVKEFPKFVELWESHRDDVACASLNLDYYGGEGNSPEDSKPQVLKFLTEQNATMTNFISSDPDSAVLKEIPAVAVPVVLVYDRQGKLHKIFRGDSAEYMPDGFSYEKDVEPVVNQLIIQDK